MEMKALSECAEHERFIKRLKQRPGIHLSLLRAFQGHTDDVIFNFFLSKNSPQKIIRYVRTVTTSQNWYGTEVRVVLFRSVLYY